MKIQIVGNAFVLTSTLTPAEIKKLNAEAPEALAVVDEETKNEPFRVSFGANGGVSKYGVTFNGTAVGDGKAVFNGVIEGPVTSLEQAREYVADTLGHATAYLREIEAKAAEKLAALATERAALINEIEIVG